MKDLKSHARMREFYADLNSKGHDQKHHVLDEMAASLVQRVYLESRVVPEGMDEYTINGSCCIQDCI